MSDRPGPDAFAAAYRALDAGDIAAARMAAERIAADAPPGDLSACLLQVEIRLRDQRWEEADALLASLPAEAAATPLARLKRFEVACFLGRMREAEELRALLEQDGPVPRDFEPPILRYLAERGAWGEVVRRGAAWIGADFAFAQIGTVLFRAAQRAHGHLPLTAAIEAVPGWETLPDLLRFRAALKLDRATSAAELATLRADRALPDDPVLRQRIDVRLRVAARAEATPRRRALFLCSDRAFLGPSLVTLASAADMLAPGGTDLTLVVDDALTGLARAAAAGLARDGFPLAILPASEAVPANAGLDPKFGVFTSGARLSAAAYWRIHVARMLARTGRYGRIAYLDADVIARRPIDALFDADFGAAPLAARAEPLRPETRRAIDLHGFTPGAYFNSGVLVFDARSDALEDGLAQSLAAIADPAVRLLFHDQCALNLGFRGRAALLDERLNYPVHETTALEAVPHDAALLHFADRPKPWSAAYRGECAMLWHEKWRETARRIGESTAVSLLAMTAE